MVGVGGLSLPSKLLSAGGAGGGCSDSQGTHAEPPLPSQEPALSLGHTDQGWKQSRDGLEERGNEWGRRHGVGWKMCPHNKGFGAGTFPGRVTSGPHGCLGLFPHWPQHLHQAAGPDGDRGSCRKQLLPSSALNIPPLAKPSQQQQGSQGVSGCHTRSATKPGLTLLCLLHPGDAPTRHRCGRSHPAASPSMRGHIQQPRNTGTSCPQGSGTSGLPCSLVHLRPWLLLCLAQPWALSQGLPGTLTPSLPSVVARVKCVLRPV